MLLGAANVRFTDAKCGVDEVRDVLCVTPIVDGAGRRGLGERARKPTSRWTICRRSLRRAPPSRDLPPAAQKAKSYADWTKSFTAWLTREQTLELLRSPSLGVVSKPGESERDFRVRLQQSAREARDAQVAALRQKYAPKMQALSERQRKAEQAVAREQEQVTSSRLQTGISLATTVFGAMFGRKTFSASTLGRATTAARGVGPVDEGIAGRGAGAGERRRRAGADAGARGQPAGRHRGGGSGAQLARPRRSRRSA